MAHVSRSYVIAAGIPAYDIRISYSPTFLTTGALAGSCKKNGYMQNRDVHAYVHVYVHACV